jgi:hypothetical protein
MIRPDNFRSIQVTERLGMTALREDVLLDIPVVVVYAIDRLSSGHARIAEIGRWRLT